MGRHFATCTYPKACSFFVSVASAFAVPTGAGTVATAGAGKSELLGLGPCKGGNMQVSVAGLTTPRIVGINYQKSQKKGI